MSRDRYTVPGTPGTPLLLLRILGLIILLSGGGFLLYCHFSHIHLKNNDNSGRVTRVTLYEEKVLTFQPDNSLTILDLNTGEILFRSDSTSVPSGNDDFGYIVTPYSKKIFYIWTITAVPQFFFILPHTKPAVVGMDFNQEGLERVGNRLYAVSRINRDSSRMWSMDIKDGVLVWNNEIEGQWDKIYVDEKFIYVQDYRDENILVYSHNGRFVARMIKPIQWLHNIEKDVFARDILSLYAPYEDRDKASEVFGARLFWENNGVFKLPGGGIVAISSPDYFDQQERIIHFDDGSGHGWKRKVNSCRHVQEPCRPLWTFAANNEFVVYANNYGRIECIEIGTGKSRWVYAFSRKSMGKWTQKDNFLFNKFNVINWALDEPKPFPWMEKERSLSDYIRSFFQNIGREFYTDDCELFKADINPLNIMGISGVDDHNSARVIVDDKIALPNTVESIMANVFYWFVWTAMISALIFIVNKDLNYAIQVKSLIAILLLNSLVLFFFGRYDHLMFRVLWYASWLTYVYIGYILLFKIEYRNQCDI